MLYLQYLFELLQLYIVLKPDLKNTVIKLINKEMKKITWHCALGQHTLDRLQVATNLSQYCSFFSNITNRKFLTPQVSSIGCSDLLGSLEHCSVLIINLFLNLQFSSFNYSAAFGHVQYGRRNSENTFIDRLHGHRTKRNVQENATSSNTNGTCTKKVS